MITVVKELCQSPFIILLIIILTLAIVGIFFEEPKS